MKISLQNKLNNFNQISLEQLNVSVSFQNRIDVKYLLTEVELEKFLEKLEKDFSILEIKWIKVFSYESTYMDSDDYFFYRQHINKKENKSRTKLRTRIYLNSNIAFSEYKQKENWITKKLRYQIPVTEAGAMSEWQKDFFNWLWKSFYKNEVEPELKPKIKTMYNRVTFVSNKNDERLTIDFNINLVNILNNKEKKLENLVIVESKTTSKNTKSHKILKELWIKSANSCSKYWLWLYYTWATKEASVFKKTINKINKIEKK